MPYVEHAVRYQPDEPAAFKPASLLIRAELADLTAYLPGYTGTLTDLVRDTHDALSDPLKEQALDLLSIWARFGDEVNGLLK